MEEHRSAESSTFSRRAVLKAAGATLLAPMTQAAPRRRAGEARASPGQSRRPLARRIADYVCAVRYEDLHPASIERAKEHLIYHVGLAFSGALTPNGRQAVEIARTLAEGRGNATIIGHSSPVPPLEAAFANSMFMRALGFDDVLFPSATHAGLLTYPVALAVGERRRSTGKELLAAVVTSYEVLGKMVIEQDACRAPRRPSMPFGPFASVTAATMLMKLSPSAAANAYGYAADTAMGLKEGNEQQPTHVYGWIARNAITAAVLAEAGGITSPTVLEGKYGFYNTLIGDMPDIDGLVERLDRDPEILRATQKRYPGTAMNIVPIQFMLELTEAEGLRADNVVTVDIELHEARGTFEDSISTGPYPTRTQAESSLPFQTAIILLDQGIDLARYEQLDNPEILDVIRKVNITLAPHESKRYARVRVVTKDGRTFAREGQHYEFAPLDRLGWLMKDGDKFLPRKSLQRFADLASNLEHVEHIGEMMQTLVPE